GDGTGNGFGAGGSGSSTAKYEGSVGSALTGELRRRGYGRGKGLGSSWSTGADDGDDAQRGDGSGQGIAGGAGSGSGRPSPYAQRDGGTAGAPASIAPYAPGGTGGTAGRSGRSPITEGPDNGYGVAGGASPPGRLPPGLVGGTGAADGGTPGSLGASDRAGAAGFGGTAGLPGNPSGAPPGSLTAGRPDMRGNTGANQGQAGYDGGSQGAPGEARPADGMLPQGVGEPDLALTSTLPGSTTGQRQTFSGLLRSNERLRSLQEVLDDAAEQEDLFMPDARKDNGNGEPGIPGLRIMRRPAPRRIVVECRADGLVVEPEQVFIPLESDDDAARAARALLDAARAEARGWGDPGAMFRWLPILSFHVRPDARANYWRTR
ncbi:MAG: hypothetical protein ACRDD1_16560, partial [Planctomycetia bacterium]